MKCVQCKKTIRGGGLLLSCDGDFVCDKVCKVAFHAEMDKIFGGLNNPPMTDEEFATWMGVSRD